jgi:hypothetical protein
MCTDRKTVDWYIQDLIIPDFIKRDKIKLPEILGARTALCRETYRCRSTFRVVIK